MDALVDRLIERLEALSRWGHCQTRRGFDACTVRLPCRDRMVLRHDLAKIGRQVRWWGFLLGLAVWVQGGYYARFVAGPHPDPRESVFRFFWRVFIGMFLLVDLLVVLLTVAMLVGILLSVTTVIRNSTWRHPVRTLRQRWVEHRETVLDRWRLHRPHLLVEEEQADLRRVWAQAQPDPTHRANPLANDRPGASPSPPPRRRL